MFANVYSVEYYRNSDCIILTRHFDTQLAALQWIDMLPVHDMELASFTCDIYKIDDRGFMHYVKTKVFR